MTFGEKVKTIRIKQGFSQLQLGEKMNISQQAVAKYEHLTEQPKLATIRKLANALGVSINDLTLNWSNYPPNEARDDIKDNKLNYETIDPHDEANIERIMRYFQKLNYAGQEKAIFIGAVLEEIAYIFNLIGRLPVQSGKSQIFLTCTAYNTLTKVVGGRALI